MNFSKRSFETELMDDFNCHGEVIEKTLKELAFINKFLGGNQLSIEIFDKFMKENSRFTTHKLVDLGCGGGDMLVEMAKKAREKNYKVQFTGIDANPHIIDYAKKNCAKYPEIDFQCKNILDTSFIEDNYDIAHSSLFFHHFSADELVGVLESLKIITKKIIIINDLHRHYLAYHSIGLLTAIFSRSYMVKNDAKVSVARGFTKSELKLIFSQAGLTDCEIKWRWAFRWQILINL